MASVVFIRGNFFRPECFVIEICIRFCAKSDTYIGARLLVYSRARLPIRFCIAAASLNDAVDEERTGAAAAAAAEAGPGT